MVTLLNERKFSFPIKKKNGPFMSQPEIKVYSLMCGHSS